MKAESDLNQSDCYKRRNFKNLQLTDDKVVNRLISLSNELRAAYNFYQDLILIIHNQSSERLKSLLWPEDDKNSTILPQEMDAAIKTLRKHFEEIINSFNPNCKNKLATR
jgi:transposase